MKARTLINFTRFCRKPLATKAINNAAIEIAIRRQKDFKNTLVQLRVLNLGIFRLLSTVVLVVLLTGQLFLMLMYDVVGNGFMGDDRHPVWESMLMPFICINLGLLMLILRKKKSQSS